LKNLALGSAEPGDAEESVAEGVGRCADGDTSPVPQEKAIVKRRSPVVPLARSSRECRGRRVDIPADQHPGRHISDTVEQVPVSEPGVDYQDLSSGSLQQLP
jgi:hypothetical protein